MALKSAASVVLRATATGTASAASPAFAQQCGGAASLGIRKMSSIFSASADPVTNELSNFGETKISDLLGSKGDKGTWLYCETSDTVLSAIKKVCPFGIHTFRY